MLVSCVVYKSGQKLADIDPVAISDYVCQPDCFVWVALRNPEPAELDLMQEEFGLHPLAVEDARNGHQRPKIEEYGDSLFAVLHMLEEDGSELRLGEVAIFAGRNYIVSVRNGAEKGFQEVRTRSEREPDLLRHGSGYVLYALMDAVVDRYFPLLDHLENELEAVEERIFATSSARDNMEDLYRLKQRLMTLRHAVVPLLDALGGLSGARVPVMCVGMQEYFRDVADHLQRLSQAIETARETVSTATAVNLATITLQESEVMKRLAAYGALIAVPTLIVGIYGMNFEFMPELHWRYGYWITLAAIVGIDVYLFWKFRREKWL